MQVIKEMSTSQTEPSLITTCGDPIAGNCSSTLSAALVDAFGTKMIQILILFNQVRDFFFKLNYANFDLLPKRQTSKDMHHSFDELTS